MIQQHRPEKQDKMFVENANVQQPGRHQELFLRSRPYRGELPTVAGFLLYPDTPAKMETTSREAFCFRSVPQPDRGTGGLNLQNTQQQSPHPTHQTGRGSSRDQDKEDDEQENKHNQLQESTALKTDDPADMLTLYQKDFPPPSSCRRRRTPALPQPDNIGINPAFRIEFSTVQRETYPGWSSLRASLRPPPRSPEQSRSASRK